MESNLDISQLCKYCFQVLEALCANRNVDQIPFPEKFKGQSYPLFVTWTTGKEKELRGCVGTFAKDRLETNLVKYTFISAFKDTRFNPIQQYEIKYLNCEVSLLVQFEKAKSPIDWVVGTHGIDIDFEDKYGESYSATFLPEVAEDEGWDQKTTLKYLIRKAGFRGTLDEVYNNIQVTRYQSIKKTISYDEYKNMK